MQPRTPSTHTDIAEQMALEKLAAEFGWTCWHDGDQYYARHPLTAVDDYDARGDDLADLREAILLNFPETPTDPHPPADTAH